jgi:hypothetical protein
VNSKAKISFNSRTHYNDKMKILLLTLHLKGPAHKNVIIFTAGWAFKFVPLLGKCLSQLAIDGQTEYSITDYSINRPGILGSGVITKPVYRHQPL